MKKALPWIFGLAVVGIFVYSRTKNVANTIDVAIKSIGLNFKAANIFSVPVMVTVTISNGSLISSTFNSFTGDLLYNGNVIGRINYLQPILIKATSSQDITIPVSISTSSAGRQVIDLLLSGIKNINLSINGTLVSSAGNILVNTSYKIR